MSHPLDIAARQLGMDDAWASTVNWRNTAECLSNRQPSQRQVSHTLAHNFLASSMRQQLSRHSCQQPCSRLLRFTAATAATKSITRTPQLSPTIFLLLLIFMSKVKISGGSQPPMAWNLSPRDSAGSRSLHRLVRHSDLSVPQPLGTPRPTLSARCW